MRFVIFGAGAIGGTVGARLAQAGHDVALIARGAHLRAIRAHGLRFETPDEQMVLRLPAAEDPAELEVGADGDVVLLATKSQDTAGALAALRRAGSGRVPIVCLQNGVDNERLALRLFEAVYGAVVMLPAAHLKAGYVQAYGTNLTGIIDVGRYPEGSDELCDAVTEALRASQFSARPSADVMRLKYAKLILNLGNAVGALVGSEERSDELTERARDEGRAALIAAGIAFEAPEVEDLSGRWERIGVREIRDRPRAGSSTWQSLQRGAGAIETDYLNGEIVLLARLHGLVAPLNQVLCELALEAISDRRPPGAFSAEEVLERVGRQAPAER